MARFCPQCGSQASDNAKFCPKCGAGFNTAPQNYPNVNSQYMNAQPIYNAQPDDGMEPPEKKSKAPIIIAVIVALLAIAVAAFLIIKQPWNKKADEKTGWQTKVPNVVETEVEEAKDTLTENSLHGLIHDKVETDGVNKDYIIEQSPAADTMVCKGSIVDLVLSAGRVKTFLPDVTDYTFDYANKILSDAGFKVRRAEKDMDGYASESICGQSVKSGYVEKGQEVIIQVSPAKEAEDKDVTVPDIQGMTIEEAKEKLQSVGLYLAVNLSQYSDTVPENQVISQEKSAGSQAKKGETVFVTVSLGQKKIYVPDVTYRLEEKAVQLLERAGLTVVIEHAESKDVAQGTVISQSVEAGTGVAERTEVTITVSDGYEVEVPKVTGMNENDAISKLLNAELAVKVVYSSESSEKLGTVSNQDHKKGEKVQIGTVVTITVSSKEDAGDLITDPETGLTYKDVITEPEWEVTTESTTTTTTTTTTTAQATAALSGTVVDDGNGNAVKNAVISIYKKSDSAKAVETVTSDNSGNFGAELPVDDYILKINCDGYKDAVQSVTVKPDGVSTTVRMVEVETTTEANPGNVSGYLSNAVDGKALSGVNVKVRSGSNKQSGSYLGTSTKSDSSGRYSISLNQGTYTLEFSKSGYSNSYVTVTVENNENVTSINQSLSPKPSDSTDGDQIRIVLNWNDRPRDLDSHLLFSYNGRSYENYYGYLGEKIGDASSGVTTILDKDDTDGRGPETITIAKGSATEYTYFVHNFSEEASLAGCGARVTVYYNDSQIASYTVPSSGSGDVWEVFKIKGNHITPINKIS